MVNDLDLLFVRSIAGFDADWGHQCERKEWHQGHNEGEEVHVGEIRCTTVGGVKALIVVILLCLLHLAKISGSSYSLKKRSSNMLFQYNKPDEIDGSGYDCRLLTGIVNGGECDCGSHWGASTLLIVFASRSQGRWIYVCMSAVLLFRCFLRNMDAIHYI